MNGVNVDAHEQAEAQLDDPPRLLQQQRLGAVGLLEARLVRVPADLCRDRRALMVARVAQANRVEVPDASAAAQQVMHRARRPSGPLEDEANNAADLRDGIHPGALELGRHALAPGSRPVRTHSMMTFAVAAFAPHVEQLRAPPFTAVIFGLHGFDRTALTACP